MTTFLDADDVLDQVRDGIPAALGRWQPTRAGVVNSWAWAEETFSFADGWLALTGPNGSGKSLTSSMWVTPLLDADVRQSALSIDGSASGTLQSRHTNRDQNKNVTGVWWLEYGYRADEDADTDYVSTGMWLRNSGGDLQRAFFFCPGRIGTDLLLADANRNAVTIEELAAQLATAGGDLFTGNHAVKTKALRHLHAVTDDSDYRRTIREQLFAPLDEVQFDALTSVLRSLRSVRTGQGVNPAKMQEVLTAAMPALDADRLGPIAEAMERIADLEQRLHNTHAEIDLLSEVERRYNTYTVTLVALEAAELRAAVTQFDDQTRKTREAEQRLKSANDDLTAARTERARTRTRISRLQGQLQAAQTALREHAGAELPHLEQRAKDCAARAMHDQEIAEGSRRSADQATADADREARIAANAQTHLEELTATVRRATAPVSAHAVVDALLTASAAIVSAPAASAADGPALPEVNLDRTVATPLSWTDTRATRLTQVRTTLSTHASAVSEQSNAAVNLREAQKAEADADQQTQTATAARERVEQILQDGIDSWAHTLRELPHPPADLVAPSDDRLEADPLRHWLTAAARTTRDRIDVTWHTSQVAQCAARLRDAHTQQARAKANHEKAEQLLDRARADAQWAAETAETERAEDAARRQTAVAAHEERTEHASQVHRQARHDLDAAETTVVDTGRAFVEAAATWARALTVLDPSLIPLPHLPSAETTEEARAAVSELDPADLRLAAVRAHAAAVTNLAARQSAADADVTRARDDLAAIGEQLAEARRAAPNPPAPPWRGDRATTATPFWSLVDFADTVPAGDRDTLEGALLVSGILDALVAPDGRITAGDLTIVPAAHPLPQGRLDSTSTSPAATLADVLTPDERCVVDADVVHALLRAIPFAPARPADGTLTGGTLAVGPLTAAAPPGYQAQYIGPTTRERARQARVAALEDDERAAQTRLAQAQDNARALTDARITADTERDTVPTGADLALARRNRDTASDAVTSADQWASSERAAADLALTQAEAELAARERDRRAALDAHDQTVRTRADTVNQEAARLTQADTDVAERQEEQEDAQRAFAEAEEAQTRADTERDAFPALGALEKACTHEDRAEEDLARARQTSAKASERHERASLAAREQLHELNRVARLEDGTLLPTDHAALDAYRDSVAALAQSITAWRSAAQRALDLLRRARQEDARARAMAGTATTHEATAATSHNEAEKAAAALNTARALHGKDYEEQRATRDQIAQALTDTESTSEELIETEKTANGAAERAQATLDSIAPHRAEAERHRDACVRTLSRLVDEGIAAVPDGITTDDTGRPANLTAAITWARRITEELPKSRRGDRDSLAKARGHQLTALEGAVRAASATLARFDRQVTLVTVDGTEWRRAEVAAPEAARGEELGTAMTALRESADLLESDLRDDVKATLKTSMFTQLRKDIQRRREMAQDLVRGIRKTLDTVRTGVAGVGVRVSWEDRKDADATQMIELITAPPSDETFERMYQVLRTRMNETVGEAWQTRVEKAFDYRQWHEWKIEVTHASFGPPGSETFRPVTPRNNPLASLSTGEGRLATMLPLLAAAWSMYSGHAFTGPRLVSIDELEATFDEPNLRQVLALMRRWNLDVIATAPSISPLVKAESGQVVIHQVMSAGKQRVSVPWLWAGSGEPVLFTWDEPR